MRKKIILLFITVLILVVGFKISNLNKTNKNNDLVEGKLIPIQDWEVELQNISFNKQSNGMWFMTGNVFNNSGYNLKSITYIIDNKSITIDDIKIDSVKQFEVNDLQNNNINNIKQITYIFYGAYKDNNIYELKYNINDNKHYVKRVD